MTTYENGPPKCEVPVPHREPAPTTTTTTEVDNRNSSRFDDLAARAARCAAKKRMTPIGGCGCDVRDPDVDVHRCTVEIKKIFTHKQVDAAVAAAEHLVLLGTPGCSTRTSAGRCTAAAPWSRRGSASPTRHGEAASTAAEMVDDDHDLDVTDELYGTSTVESGPGGPRPRSRSWRTPSTSWPEPNSRAPSGCLLQGHVQGVGAQD